MRKGFSTTEILIGTALFAVALIPIITLIAGGTRPAAFNEYHVAAQARASQTGERVAALIISRGFAEAEKIGIGDSVDLDDTKQYKLPEDADAKAKADAAFVGMPKVKLTNLATPSASLLRISTTVEYTIPGDATKHSFTADRFLCRPEIGLMNDYEPRTVEGGAVP